MAVALIVLAVAVLARAQPASEYLVLGNCSNAIPLAFDPSTQQIKTSGGLCIEWSGTQDDQQSPNTYLAPCATNSAQQKWHFDETSTSVTLTIASSPSDCLNVQDYGTTEGNEVWTCNFCSGCKDNCYWRWASGPGGPLVNPASGLCLARVGPPKPTTCSPGSIASNLSFCDKSLTHEARAAALVAMLTTEEKLSIWSPTFPSAAISRLNIKQYMWDSTCIHGPAPYHLSPAPRVTVTATAINLGATFDLDLVQQVSNMTAIEMRGVTQMFYNLTNGNGVLALGCDGGPLANSAHDPRWGRISETYGEDPYLISRVGTVATRGMQQATAVGGDTFIATSQTTRHYLGYHQSNLMPIPAMNVSTRELYDQYLPAYQSFQVDGDAWTGDPGGRAEAIMCSYAAVAGVPSCASHDLLTTHLRTEWGSTALVQSDCCDSITSIWNMHHYVPSLEDAVVVATKAGTQLQYGTESTAGRQAFQDALTDGKLTMADLDGAVSRIMLVRFRVGEFDDDNPFSSVAGSDLIPLVDAPAHRALARKTAADSIVLLRNNGILPLSSALGTVAVVGPFADATDEFLHSYNGVPSSIANPLAAVQELFHGTSTTITYEEGTGIVTPSTTSSIAKAAAAAAAADVTIAVLGLGTPVEAEGLDRGEGRGSIVGLGLPPVQQQLLDALHAASSKIVLVLVSGGGVSLANDTSAATIWAGYGGEEAGHGITDVLWGAVAPNGRLPQTVYMPNYLSQVGPELDYSLTSGVGRTYRYLTVPPLYFFGYGLTYTTFFYSNLTMATWEIPDFLFFVTVTNIGKVAAASVAQLYVQVPPLAGTPVPRIALQGFTKTVLLPGQSADLTFRLVPRQLQTVGNDGVPRTTPGAYTVHVGDHQPADTLGLATSNVVSISFTL
eukprot:m.39025 g.39025  ORF g.39025 m.39025 type:complete len:896 (+) comp5543_c0_seq2:78-2765(+)